MRKNRVFKDGVELTDAQIFDEAFALTPKLKKKFCKRFFDVKEFVDERLEGYHCYCSDGGTFELLPLETLVVQQSKKRYMRCTRCGGYSHL